MTSIPVGPAGLALYLNLKVSSGRHQKTAFATERFEKQQNHVQSCPNKVLVHT